jgi:hypothetical protein
MIPLIDINICWLLSGIDGCCNDDPAPSGEQPLNGAANSGSTGVPYIQVRVFMTFSDKPAVGVIVLQLLTCMASNQTFNASMPTGALLFSPLLGCTALGNGWQLAEGVAGRMLVALPAGGLPGADFGGASLSPNATSVPGTAHDLSGTVHLGSSDIGLASGCCADGYAGAADVPFSATTTVAAPGFPFLMVAACVQAQ